jgi:DNA-binding GntR family transcriptional regulator
MEGMIEKRSLGAQVFQHIKAMILNQELKGGERIPEQKIARLYGVSRTPIREALHKLEEYGLVKIYPRRHAEVVRVDRSDRAHIAQILTSLECLAVRLLAQNASDEQCDTLQQLARDCIALAKAGDQAAVFAKNSEFHLTISRLTANPYLYEIQRDLDVKIQLLRSALCISLDEVCAGLNLHLSIVDSIRRHDGEKAEALMREHLAAFHRQEPPGG